MNNNNRNTKSIPSLFKNSMYLPLTVLILSQELTDKNSTIRYDNDFDYLFLIMFIVLVVMFQYSENIITRVQTTRT